MRRGYIRGGIPALPIFGLILLISSLAGMSFLRVILLGGSAKAQLLSLTEKVVTVMDGEGEVVIPKDTYLFIDSCTHVLTTNEKIRMGDVEFDDREMENIRKRCLLNGGVVCAGKKIANTLVRYCSYSVKEPKIEEPISMVTEKEVIIVSKEESEMETKIEVK